MIERIVYVLYYIQPLRESSVYDYPAIKILGESLNKTNDRLGISLSFNMDNSVGTCNIANKNEISGG